MERYMNTRPKYRVRVVNEKVFVGDYDGEYTIWQSLESILFFRSFFKIEPQNKPLESFGYMLIDNGTVLRYRDSDPQVETVEPPY